MHTLYTMIHANYWELHALIIVICLISHWRLIFWRFMMLDTWANEFWIHMKHANLWMKLFRHDSEAFKAW